MTRRDEGAERPASFASQGRARIVGLVRAVPIRWRILSIAALNSAVVVVLVAMIWNGVGVLGSAWEDVRQVRESDKILALLESETGRLQNLIHRYINQPSPELFAEILLLREAVLSTLTTRASTDPMLSGSVEELERVTERFLNGFGELRGVQATISKTYEEQVLTPQGRWPGSIRLSRAPPGVAMPRSGPRLENPAKHLPRCWSRLTPIIFREPQLRPRRPAAPPKRSRGRSR